MDKKQFDSLPLAAKARIVARNRGIPLGQAQLLCARAEPSIPRDVPTRIKTFSGADARAARDKQRLAPAVGVPIVANFRDLVALVMKRTGLPLDRAQICASRILAQRNTQPAPPTPRQRVADRTNWYTRQGLKLEDAQIRAFDEVHGKRTRGGR
jgi:hypothetical protein